MRLGVHVSIAGGLNQALERAVRLSCTTMQMFSRSPRGGHAPRPSGELLESFQAQRRLAGIEPLVVHCPYILNLASPDRRIFAQSLALYQEEYARSQELGAAYLVTHVGSHRGAGEDAGIRRVADALNRTLDGARHPRGAAHEANAGAQTVMILLENTAGSGQGLGYQFEQLAAMRQQVERADAVGVCLDTAHLFAAGYPIHTASGLAHTLEACDRVVGLEHVKLIHLNDSKVPFESRVDRHWHIGEGQIGRDAMRRIVNEPRFQSVPWILETPKESEEDDRRNLTTVRGLIEKPVGQNQHGAGGESAPCRTADRARVHA